MRLIQELQTRALRFINPTDARKSFAPDVVAAIRDRYRFWEYPTKPSEFNLDDAGGAFSVGLFDGNTIEALRLFRTCAIAEGTCNTSMLDRFLDDLFAMAQTDLGLDLECSSPVSRAYLSAVEIELAPSLAQSLNVAARVGETLHRHVAALGFSTSAFELSGFALQADPLKSTPLRPSKFLFERRADRPFESNIFYSEAPLPTDQHLEVLQEMENLF